LCAAFGTPWYAGLYSLAALRERLPANRLLADPAYLFASFLFGAIGLAAFVYGKKLAQWKPMVTGVVLMAFPYFVSRTWVVYAIGAALCVLLFVWRD